jgi:glyoxylase-like metal-dependent hydrolase (beta-lactamase superfamily II)/rhodanese-related sulfurtransferase
MSLKSTTQATAPELAPMHSNRDCRAYLLFDPDSREAALIDPRFDLTRDYRAQLERRELKLKYVIDSHTHADHLSGGDRFRNLTGCKVVMFAKTGSKVPNLRVEDGQQLKLGDLGLTFMHTPGHTPDSMSIFDGRRVFTGDALFIGGAARTDFMGGSSAQLFDSFRKLEALGDDIEIWPGHDYNGKESSTVGREKQTNNAFMQPTRDALVKLLAMKGPLPANMEEILSFNTRAGMPEAEIVTPADVARFGTPGKDFTLLDSRYIDEWQAGRIANAVHVPLPEVADRWAEIAKLPHPIVSVCRSGVRATYVMMTARKNNDKDWFLMEGGMQAWNKAKLPMLSDTGAEPQVISSKFAVGGSCAAGTGTCAAG